MLEEDARGALAEMRGAAAPPDMSQPGAFSRQDPLKGALGIVLLVVLPGIVCVAGSVIGDSGMGLLLALGMVVVVCAAGAIVERLRV